MTTLLIIGATVAFLLVLVMGAIRSARSRGAAEQRADDVALAKEVEEQIHEIQAEHRDTPTTKERLKKGTF